MLTLYKAPTWAEAGGRPGDATIYPGAWDPDPAQFATFARAAAQRYSGRFPDPLQRGARLPAVRTWQIWNEENLPYYLAAPDLVGEYRALLNAGYGAIKAVNRGNLIVTGGLAPVSFLPPLSISPLQFGAELMCLNRVGTAFVRSACPRRAEFDVFAEHPYSLAATPTKPAYEYDDVLVADMGKLDDLLNAAHRWHTVTPDVRHPLWVTEFAWFTNPPNTVNGDSDPTAARYVAYSMYEMWRGGVQFVMWQTLRDVANAGTPGGGLEWITGRPKLMLTAFRFPVIASVRRGRGYLWGRAPVFRPVRVVVERLTGRSWRRVGTIRTGADGVFQLRFAARGNGVYRSRVPHGPASLPYDSRSIPPLRTHLQ